MQFPRLVAIAVTALLAGGCGSASERQTEQDRRAEEAARSLGVDAKVSTNADGSKSVTVERSGAGVTVQGGTNLSLPSGFPTDVPLYPGMNIVGSAELPNQGFTLQGHSADALDKVAAFHVSQMSSSGWTNQAATVQMPTMRALTFRKGNRTTTINLLEAQGTSVQMTTMVTQ